MKIPKISTVGMVTVGHDGDAASLEFSQPQIIQHLAFLPIRTSNVKENLLEVFALIEEFKLEHDIIVRDHGNYDTAVYENKTNKTLIVPPATHMKGGHQNRGNNEVEVIADGDTVHVNVNCFEPSRGSGNDTFVEFDDVPPDVARETMKNTEGYNGTWNIIRDYTNLTKNANGDALSSYNSATAEKRAKFALNFETMEGQTGAVIITKDLTMVEIFPTPNTFNVYAQRVMRGKAASLYHKLSEEKTGELVMPSEVEERVEKAITALQMGIDQTLHRGTKKNGAIIGRARAGNKVMDIILTDTEPPQLAYAFGVF